MTLAFNFVNHCYLVFHFINPDFSNFFTFTVSCWFFNCSAASISGTSSASVVCCDSDCCTTTMNGLWSLPNHFCAFGNPLWMAWDVYWWKVDLECLLDVWKSNPFGFRPLNWCFMVHWRKPESETRDYFYPISATIGLSNSMMTGSIGSMLLCSISQLHCTIVHVNFFLDFVTLLTSCRIYF